MTSLIGKVEINPSRLYAILLFALHLGSALVVYLTNIPWIVKWVLFVLIASSLAYFWIRDVKLRLPFSWREIFLTGNDLIITTHDGSQVTGLVLDYSVVFSYFIILRLRDESRYIEPCRIFFKDAVSPERFRQLCVQLRFSIGTGASSR